MSQKPLREISRNIVSGVIFSADRKILLGIQDTSANGVYVGCWHIPGGGMEAGETKLETLIREIQEETGLDVTNAKIELLDDTQKAEAEKTLKETGERVLCHMSFNDYRVDLIRSSSELALKPTSEMVELQWVAIKDLKNLKLTPPSIDLFKKMGLL